MTTVAVLDHGTGNLRSVVRAIERVGGAARITGRPEDVLRADALVIPGVGHFGACMRNLARLELDGAVRRFAGTGRPVFGVCLGMQVLFERSDEDPAAGLGLLPGRSRALPKEVRVPHMGWNTVEWISSHPYVEGIASGTWFSFAHSFAPDVAEGATIAVTEHGRRFSSVVASGNVFATQFHPEKSGDAGLCLYEAFVRASS